MRKQAFLTAILDETALTNILRFNSLTIHVFLAVLVAVAETSW